MSWYHRIDVNLSTGEEEQSMIYRDGEGGELILPAGAAEELASILGNVGQETSVKPDPQSLSPLPAIPQPAIPQSTIPQPVIPQPNSMEPLDLEDTPVPSGFTPAQNLTTPLPVQPEDTGTGAWRIANPEDK